jgi:hypothetical protein
VFSSYVVVAVVVATEGMDVWGTLLVFVLLLATL